MNWALSVRGMKIAAVVGVVAGVYLAVNIVLDARKSKFRPEVSAPVIQELRIAEMGGKYSVVPDYGSPVYAIEQDFMGYNRRIMVPALEDIADIGGMITARNVNNAPEVSVRVGDVDVPYYPDALATKK